MEEIESLKLSVIKLKKFICRVARMTDVSPFEAHRRIYTLCNKLEDYGIPELEILDGLCELIVNTVICSDRFNNWYINYDETLPQDGPTVNFFILKAFEDITFEDVR